MTNPEESHKQPELLKYGTEPFANYQDEDGDVRPISDLSPDDMEAALQDYREQRWPETDTDEQTLIRPETSKAAKKQAAKRVGRRAVGRPAVGEEGRLLNVEDHSGAQTPEEKQIARAAGDEREKNIMIQMSGEWQDALDRGDVDSAARLYAAMEERRKRREELGYGQVDISPEE